MGSIHLALKPTLGILAGIRGNKAESWGFRAYGRAWGLYRDEGLKV